MSSPWSAVQATLHFFVIELPPETTSRCVGPRSTSSRAVRVDGRPSHIERRAAAEKPETE